MYPHLLFQRMNLQQGGIISLFDISISSVAFDSCCS
jgi:hypothetical protein